ncbi:MAG: DNA ligase-associated DEXH box helicase, partial [Planctomycetota bacterium]
VFIHGAVQPFCRIYRARGVDLPEFRTAKHFDRRDPEHPRGLVVAPPSVDGSNWMKRFGSAGRVATAFASGWMQMRGTRRRRNVERGFVLSDHDDWPSLLRTIRSTGAAKVLLTHGFTEPLAKYLREHEGIDAGTLRTRFESENQERTT